MEIASLLQSRLGYRHTNEKLVFLLALERYQQTCKQRYQRSQLLPFFAWVLLPRNPFQVFKVSAWGGFLPLSTLMGAYPLNRRFLRSAGGKMAPGAQDG